MSSWVEIFRRELADYFYTPIAYIFLVIFLILSAVLTFQVGDFFGRQQADLIAFFSFHPWLYLVLAPALGMRLWAEERNSGTIQPLLTLPITTLCAVWAKFFASWMFTAFALALTFPIWISVNYLGNPDNGVIVASYIGSFLLAGSYLAVSSCMSALTQNQVVAFVLAVAVNLLLTLGSASGASTMLSPWLPSVIVETILSFGYLSRFESIIKGVISVPDIVYLVSLPALFVYLSVVAVDYKKNSS